MLRDLAAVDPGAYRARRELATRLARAGRSAQAIAACEQAFLIDPYAPALHRLALEQAESIEGYEAALREPRVLAALEPGTPRWPTALARVLAEATLTQAGARRAPARRVVRTCSRGSCCR